jgi:diacylglycerol kinase (ATP)
MGRPDGWAFIVNPIAGNGYGKECAGIVREMMTRHGVSGEVSLTRSRMHATELAASFAEKGFRFVVGVGGDGTMSEVAEGLVGRGDVTFGAVPAGTGNDFIHILGFPDRFADAQWQALFKGAETSMDVGRCNGKHFINGMGLGFDAQVAWENYQGGSGTEVRKGSKAKYTWHIVKNILTYHERPMRVTIGGRTEERRSFLNTIANGRRLAGGLMLTPRAIANDGLLDYCSTDPLSLFMRFRELIAVSRQTHLQEKVFHYEQVARIGFAFEGEVPAHLDGELIFAREFNVDIVRGGLRVIYDPAGPHYFRN